MTQLYFMEIEPRGNDIVLEKMMTYISRAKKERLLRYRSDIDRKTGVYAEILVRCMICVKFGVRLTDIDIQVSRTGKPFISGFPCYEFNISHTRSAVAVALSDKPVGVDVEKIREIDFRVAEKVFSDHEKAWLNVAAPDSQLRFLEIWTKKEALVKYYGTGLTNDLKSADVTVTRENLATYFSDGYVISVCSDADVQEIDFARLSERDFIKMWRNLTS